MEPKCECVVSPGSVETCLHGDQSCRYGGVSAERKAFLSHHCECSHLNVEWKTEQLTCEVKLKNIPITTDKDFTITLLKIYQLGFCQNNLHSRHIPHRETWQNFTWCLGYFTRQSFPHFSVRFVSACYRYIQLLHPISISSLCPNCTHNFSAKKVPRNKALLLAQ